jgi:hypothetical protein
MISVVKVSHKATVLHKWVVRIVLGAHPFAFVEPLINLRESRGLPTTDVIDS